MPARDVVAPPSTRSPADRTLDELRFVIGDYVDVAFLSGPPGIGDAGGRGPVFATRDFGGKAGERREGGGGGGRKDFGGGPVPVDRGGAKTAADAWGVPADVRGPAGTGTGWGRGGGGVGRGGMGVDRGADTTKPADRGWGRRAPTNGDRDRDQVSSGACSMWKEWGLLTVLRFWRSRTTTGDRLRRDRTVVAPQGRSPRAVLDLARPRLTSEPDATAATTTATTTATSTKNETWWETNKLQQEVRGGRGSKGVQKGSVETKQTKFGIQHTGPPLTPASERAPVHRY